MALGTHQQFQTLLSEKKHVLITAQTHATGDHIASTLALSLFLDALNVRSDIIIAGFNQSLRYNFLPQIEKIKNEFEYLKKFILNIDIRDSGIKELSYDVKDNETLHIYITPKHGEIEKRKITTSESHYKYDAIVVIDADDLASIGALYEKHPPLFFETPLINISHSASNEQFGNINLIDITASSTAEVLFELFQTTAKEHISEQIATTLLTGMISKTNSFKQKNITPKSLGNASKLMRLGADRDFIIEKLYRTRSINSLKLWGEALTHLQYDSEHHIVWTTLTRESFSRSGATEEDLTDLVPELISSSPTADVIFIFHEHPKDSTIHGIIYTSKKHDSRKLIKTYNPIGTASSAHFYMRDKSLKEVENTVLSFVKNQL